jgi:putative oxidoreductase
MKQLYLRTFPTANVDVALLILSIGISFLMICLHGYPKVLKFMSDDPIVFADILGMGATVSLLLAIFGEVICSIFVAIGFSTRLTVIPPLITMLVVIFLVQAGEPMKKIELPIFYSLGYIVLMLTGAGKYSIDYLIAGKRNPYSSRSL